MYMTFTRPLLLSALIAALASGVCAGPGAADDGVREARAAIEAANARFRDAFARGDTDALAAMYTPDAIVLPPDHAIVRGRDAIGRFWKATREGGVESATLTTVDVGRSGDAAYEVGTVTLGVHPAGKEPTTARAKYVVVWLRQPDGTWKLHRDIWNALPAEPSR